MSTVVFDTGFCPFKTKDVGSPGEQCIPTCKLYVKDEGCTFVLLLKESRKANDSLDDLIAASS